MLMYYLFNEYFNLQFSKTFIICVPELYQLLYGDSWGGGLGGLVPHFQCPDTGTSPNRTLLTSERHYSKHFSFGMLTFSLQS